jgi:hypothetical protein
VIGPYAPSGTRLPVVPRFKANLIARYNFPLGDWNGFGQAAYVYQDSSTPLLFPSFYQTGNNGTTHLGEMPPYSLAEFESENCPPPTHQRVCVCVSLRVSSVLAVSVTSTIVRCFS